MIATCTGMMTLNDQLHTYDVAGVEGRGGGLAAYVWITTSADRAVFYGQAGDSQSARREALRMIFTRAGVTTPENLDAIVDKSTLCNWMEVYTDCEIDQWMREVMVRNDIDAGKEIAKSAWRVARLREEADARRAEQVDDDE